MPLTRQEFETALDAGRVEANMGGGKWWRARRNGATKLWKTRPNEFRIPVKAGFRATGYATNGNYLPGDGMFRIVE